MPSYVVLIHFIYLAFRAIELLSWLIQVFYLVFYDMTIESSAEKLSRVYLAFGSRLNAVVKFCKALALSPLALYILPNIKYGFALSGEASFSLINSRSAAYSIVI